jgi:hypothetical protein
METIVLLFAPRLAAEIEEEVLARQEDLVEEGDLDRKKIRRCVRDLIEAGTLGKTKGGRIGLAAGVAEELFGILELVDRGDVSEQVRRWLLALHVSAGQCKEPGAGQEIERLSDFILDKFPNEPGRAGVTESAVDVAIRLLGAQAGERGTE